MMFQLSTQFSGANNFSLDAVLHYEEDDDEDDEDEYDMGDGK